MDDPNTSQQAELQQHNKSEYVVKLRNLQVSDYADLFETMTEAYVGMTDGPWKLSQIQKLLDIFPGGQLCLEMNGKVVACALSLIVDYSKIGDTHTYSQIIHNGTFKTHTPDGDVLYGIDVFVHPDFRGMRLGRRLYDGRKELCESLNLRSIVAGGRIPNYEKHADSLSPKEFIEKVKVKEIYDPILTFQLSNDFHVKKVLRNYLTSDPQSRSFATLIEWNNVYYEENEKLINTTKSVIRIGLAQWQMRSVSQTETLIEQMEFFVDSISGYKSDFILFPEFFNAPLMARFNEMTESDAIRGLAGFTEELRQKFSELAVFYNINIITGSMPVLDEEGKLYNISYLCRRDGTWDSQKKIHITPAEVNSWGMNGGNSLKVFDTDCGRVAILICYDVEFPELPRILAEQGIKILFVPFLTDTQNGYNRVRCCAQARAIENECYVAIAGCVGNLPKVNNMDIQYAQSSVFSPSDFAFPTNGVVAEATPNAEMVVIADVNVDLLKDLHSHGSVKNLKDRRTDLYSLTWINQS